MQGATRLLVSHQRHHLPRCDRIVVLRGGRIVADGSFRQLQALGFEAELGSGQAAELDDTAYDQNTASAGSAKAPEPGTAQAALQAEVPGMPKPGQATGTEQQACSGDTAELPKQVPVTGSPGETAACTEPSQQDISANSPGSLSLDQAPMQATKGRVQAPSSVFQGNLQANSTAANSSTQQACIPAGVQKVRGPFGTLSSRLGRVKSRPSGSISGAPSMGRQLRGALSRWVSCRLSDPAIT